MENLKLDISEKHGIELITENDVNILSIGTAKVKYLERRLHSKESISNFLTKSGFTIDYIKEYEEVLYRGYKSEEKNPKPNSIIEICASKSVV